MSRVQGQQVGIVRSGSPVFFIQPQFIWISFYVF